MSSLLKEGRHFTPPEMRRVWLGVKLGVNIRSNLIKTVEFRCEGMSRALPTYLDGRRQHGSNPAICPPKSLLSPKRHGGHTI